MTLTLEDVLAAQARIASGIYHSPCPESIPLSEIAGCQIFCKLDYLQRTGSFKERGARNALLLLDEEHRRRGVISASAGNHALGLAYHGKLLEVPVTVVMPKFAPLIKRATCQRLGANIVLHGESFHEAYQHARSLADESGLTYIHGFNDPPIIAGQGTVGLEILEQVPDVEAIVVPVGGGGLVAGVALAVKSRAPHVQIYGVEPQRSAGFAASLAAGQVVSIAGQPTVADGLAVSQVGDLAFDIAKQRVDGVAAVTEEELSLAMLRLVELEKSVVEGGGAAPLAALIAGKLPQVAGRRTVIILSGGNVDPLVLSRVIERALVTDGRLCRFTAVVPDRPGGLARLTQVIAESGASIEEITHDRAFSGSDIGSVNILCTVETSDRQHLDELHRMLKREGIRTTPLPFPEDPPPAGQSGGR
ncbi:MAG: threonine ammonia-lyase [Planctomycetota bacterium]|nr:MAG: threonine ammonia-lyase [Planctomycetota bacterium]